MDRRHLRPSWPRLSISTGQEEFHGCSYRAELFTFHIQSEFPEQSVCAEWTLLLHKVNSFFSVKPQLRLQLYHVHHLWWCYLNTDINQRVQFSSLTPSMITETPKHLKLQVKESTAGCSQVTLQWVSGQNSLVALIEWPCRSLISFTRGTISNAEQFCN